MTTSSHSSDPTRAPRALVGPAPVTGDEARTVFGQVMGVVAVTIGFLALGAYVGRDLSGGLGIALFVVALGSLLALNVASARGSERLASTFLLTLGLLLGLALGPLLNGYASADPSALWQAAGATAAFVAILGSVGYATRRDLSSWARTLFWAIVALITFGVVAIFVSIPHAHVIYACVGLLVFGGYTIFDFNRLRRAGNDDAVPIAASIFLDILNVFLLLLQLFASEQN